MQDYKDQIQQSSMTNGAIPNAETAKKVAEVILNEIYGADQISERKPLVAKFDDQSKVWLVQGTLPENILGGVPNILLQQADGKVLAVWHEK
ncbi:NTF2 fold immunity protein [Paenibacillus sp. NEAU-GSW1]|uniref:NTF2 fold immunity protein n=1 Tax=Paenibacillus sp. NEAU-GSW1 TaxID=2682486 RepID=UPI0012E25532|nr:NTF2 fold immunity protein [Paenibacillus sp. NEAU-GSW1]MUT67483.1 hypothetical protein [Paenibacillus sp. NEAU-GSW1]